jgi:hypothetical protein
VADRSRFESAASGALAGEFSRVVSVCMGVSTFSMFDWAPSGCPPFRPEALQPAQTGHNHFGTDQEGGLWRRFHAEVLGGERKARDLFLVGDSLLLQHPYRFPLYRVENAAIRRRGLGLLKERLVHQTGARKGLEFLV